MCNVVIMLIGNEQNRANESNACTRMNYYNI